MKLGIPGGGGLENEQWNVTEWLIDNVDGVQSALRNVTMYKRVDVCCKVRPGRVYGEIRLNGKSGGTKEK